MKFKFKEKNKEGQIIEGVVEANDRYTLAHDMLGEGGIPILITEEKNAIKKSFAGFNIFKKVSLSEKIIFTNNLSGMLSAGLSLNRALSVLEKQSTNKTFKKVIKSLVDEIDKGGNLSSGMKKYPKVFSTVFVSMVRAGEESGNLPGTLKDIGVTLKKSYDLNKKIKGAMTYPSVIVCAMLIIGVFLMIYVVPTLTRTFKDTGGELPTSTKIIIWLSDTLSNHLLFFIVGIMVLVVGIILLSKVKLVQRYFDKIVLYLPVIGTIIKEVNTARTARTLSSLLMAGVSISNSLSITEDILQNVHYKELIHRTIGSIEKGMVLSESFKSNTFLYPIMMGEMIEVGEETGNLSKMLVDIANFYENEVDNKTKNLSTIIEPLLMVFIGGAVGFFAISMISPMYSVMNNIQ